MRTTSALNDNHGPSGSQPRYTLDFCQSLPPFDRGVSLLCWAYNEEGLIEDFLKRAGRLMESVCQDYEIVVVDDCSTDRTNEIIREAMAANPRIRLHHNETNRNVGYSSRKAIELARKEFLFWQTVDWSYDISKLRCFLELLHTYDVVAGVRRAPVAQRSFPGRFVNTVLQLFGHHMTKRSDTLGKAVVSIINYSLIRFLFGLPMSDYQNVVFYQTEHIQSVTAEADSSFVNPELLLKSFWKGKHIVEAPINFIPRTLGEAKGTKLKAISKSVRDVFHFWFHWIALGHRPYKGYPRGSVTRLNPSLWGPEPADR